MPPARPGGPTGPGNDLFVVVNRGWEDRLADEELVPIYERGSLKLQYTFRF